MKKSVAWKNFFCVRFSLALLVWHLQKMLYQALIGYWISNGPDVYLGFFYCPCALRYVSDNTP